MGTRSITEVLDDNGDVIISMYRQMDGYPEGMGADLQDFLAGMTVVNGLSGGQPKKVANGIQCLAAQLVAHFKVGAGDVYLYPPSMREEDGTYDVWEEYIYRISMQEDMLVLQCFDAANDMKEIDLENEPMEAE